MSRITRAGGIGESHKLILGKFDSYIRTQGKAKIPLTTNVRLVNLKTLYGPVRLVAMTLDCKSSTYETP